jgi:hypothetical protein
MDVTLDIFFYCKSIHKKLSESTSRDQPRAHIGLSTFNGHVHDSAAAAAAAAAASAARQVIALRAIDIYQLLSYLPQVMSDSTGR